MKKINTRIDELGKQFSHLQRKIESQKENGEKRAADVIENTKSEIQALHQKLAEADRETKSKLSTDLTKAHTAFAEKRESLRSKIDERKAKNEKDKSCAQVLSCAEYAEFAIDYAEIAINDATLAFYEAVEKAEEYLKQYGE